MTNKSHVGKIFVREVKYRFFRFIRIVGISESNAKGKPLVYSTVTISDDANPKRVSDEVRTIQAKRLDSVFTEWREIELDERYPEEIGLELAKEYMKRITLEEANARS